MTHTTLICGLGLLVYSLSEFVPTARFAWLMLGLLAAALVGDLVFLPSLLVGPIGRWLDIRDRTANAEHAAPVRQPDAEVATP